PAVRSPRSASGDGTTSRTTRWGIDYHLATPRLAQAAVAAGTDREPAADRWMSDHAPRVVRVQSSIHALVVMVWWPRSS
ncbi:hypothetical protein O4328_45075, partial [Rhodococcus opacus]|nr:hypothetical protein [Rhodococcus opacus]